MKLAILISLMFTHSLLAEVEKGDCYPTATTKIKGQGTFIKVIDVVNENVVFVECLKKTMKCPERGNSMSKTFFNNLFKNKTKIPNCSDFSGHELSREERMKGKKKYLSQVKPDSTSSNSTTEVVKSEKTETNKKLTCTYYHPKKAFHLCRNYSMGKCVSVTSHCTPADTCTYNQKTKRYQKCNTFSSGQCTGFSGTICKPKDLCLFDFKADAFKECTSFSIGECKNRNNYCAPKTKER